MKLAIITGVSRGLGEVTAKLLMTKGFHIIGVSRSKRDLQNIAHENNVTYTHFGCDLGNLTEVNNLCLKITDILTKEQPKKCYLVNNAAVLQPIDQVMNISSDDFAYHVQVNTTTPIVLMNHCLRETYQKNIAFTGVNITSGAAERPVYGWSAYCSTKASMNMYTKTVALEQNQLQTGNNVIAFSPGVMDTDMQQEIRNSTEEQFIEVETFRQYKKQNHLRDPHTVGQVLVDILVDDAKVENGKIYYLSDYV